MLRQLRRSHGRAARRIPGAGRSRVRTGARGRDVFVGALRRRAEADPREAQGDHRDHRADAARGESRRMVAVHADLSQVRASRRKIGDGLSPRARVDRVHLRKERGRHAGMRLQRRAVGTRRDGESPMEGRLGAQMVRAQSRLRVVRKGSHRLGAAVGTDSARDGRAAAAGISVRDVSRRGRATRSRSRWAAA